MTGRIRLLWAAGRRDNRRPGRGAGRGPSRHQLQRDRLRELTVTRARLLWAGLAAAATTTALVATPAVVTFAGISLNALD